MGCMGSRQRSSFAGEDNDDDHTQSMATGAAMPRPNLVTQESDVPEPSLEKAPSNLAPAPPTNPPPKTFNPHEVPIQLADYELAHPDFEENSDEVIISLSLVDLDSFIDGKYHINHRILRKWIKQDRHHNQFYVVDTRTHDFIGGNITGANNHTYENFSNDEYVFQLLQDFSGYSDVLFHCMYSSHRGPRCAYAYWKALQETIYNHQQQHEALELVDESVSDDGFGHTPGGPDDFPSGVASPVSTQSKSETKSPKSAFVQEMSTETWKDTQNIGRNTNKVYPANYHKSTMSRSMNSTKSGAGVNMRQRVWVLEGGFQRWVSEYFEDKELVEGFDDQYWDMHAYPLGNEFFYKDDWRPDDTSDVYAREL